MTNEGDRPYLLSALDGDAARAAARRRAVHVHRPLGARAAPGPRGVARRRVHRARTAAGARRTSTRRCCSPEPPVSASGRARCGASTSRGAATTPCSPSGCPTGGGRSRPASCCTRARSRWRPASRIARPRSSPSTATTGSRPPPSSITPALRARPSHPVSPRPVLVNTWEAVYFDHDLTTLQALADRAAQVGIERFVLDDGWFGSRRDDTSGLGDWVVSPAAHPAGPQAADRPCQVARAWTSVSGSNRRWSTRTATCTAPTPSGRS